MGKRKDRRKQMQGLESDSGFVLTVSVVHDDGQVFAATVHDQVFESTFSNLELGAIEFHIKAITTLCNVNCERRKLRGLPVSSGFGA